MNRIESISRNFTNQKSVSIGKPNEKSPDDVIIVAALRTPMTKALKGSFKDTAPELMLAHVLKEVIKQADLDPALIQDIIVGNVLQPSAGVFPARMAEIMADVPVHVPVSVTNRFCASGLESVALIAAKIKAGLIDIGIGAGVESMSFYEMKYMTTSYKLSKEVSLHNMAQKCLIPMGETSDILCKKYSLTRKELDDFSINSHKKAYFASENGHFVDEIVPMNVDWKQKEGTLKKITVSKDEGIRNALSMETMSKLKTVFTKDGLTTPGNSSQMSDGAAAVLLMRRSIAEKLGMKVIGKIVSHANIGVVPDILGTGPSEAIPLVLKGTGLSLSDIDIFEINEAFASVVVYTIKKLGLDPTKVNPKGGAIAFGHPLGATGTRQFATLLTELKRTKKKFGIISMCMGGGMGAACLIEKE